ncbi:hypothetical protein [Rhizobium sp. SL42]|nr:hypothetical protein [Rhizobium sp. SL42]
MADIDGWLWVEAVRLRRLRAHAGLALRRAAVGLSHARQVPSG